MEIFYIGFLCVGLFIAGVFVGGFNRSDKKSRGNLATDAASAEAIIKRIDKLSAGVAKSVEESLLPFMTTANSLLERLQAHPAMPHEPAHIAKVYDKIQEHQKTAHQELMTVISKLLDDPVVKNELGEPLPGNTTKSAKTNFIRDARRNERRRYNIDQHISIAGAKRADSSPFFQVSCKDLSASGVSFVCDQSLRIGQELVLSLCGASAVIFVRISVRNCRQVSPTEPGQFRVGCEFIERIVVDERLWREKFMREVPRSRLQVQSQLRLVR